MIVLGTLLHFTFAWSGRNPVVGLLSAANESVWEHCKMFILPLFIVGIFEYKHYKNLPKVLWAKLVQIVFMSLFIISFFYTYTGALGVHEILIVDIISFMLAIVFGQLISYYILNSNLKLFKYKRTPAIALILLYIVFASFTFYAPSYPLFESAVAK